ncbi:MAG: AmmeMemoRadiSam system radical SAM enzyme [Spirochaetales bacterium]|jgi:pyruvate formate lyase activating enzyme|nr:AmmeMemoRadiSam system radical SAM enzyme [Spirochaetales bacterium]
MPVTPALYVRQEAAESSPEDSSLRCLLCPHSCLLQNGKSGICGVRKNEHGDMSLPFYGHISAAAADPVEKKPLYHFFPGRNIFSAGFYGCNLRCPFCQNYHISQQFPGEGQETPPEELVEAALRENSIGIAYTYSEPLIHFEYLLHSAQEARRRGLKNVLVSNGYLNEAPATRLLPLLDAANIDLKSFSNDFYHNELGGSLEPVLRFLELAATRTHLEVTTLIIPGKNDSPIEMERIATFLADLNPDIPLHLSCYRPMYRYTIRGSTYQNLAPLLDTARRKLRYVYPGNVPGETNTLCPSCGELLIRRQGYRVSLHALKNGSCAKCGLHIAGVWE